MALAGPASADSIFFDGVTFSAVYNANVLTIEIDAAGRSGGWANAVTMDTIQVKNVGSFSSVSMTGPNGSWIYHPNELNAMGCDGGSNGGQRACFSTPVPGVALSDDMIFTFTYVGGVQDFDETHLKVRFLDAGGFKIGSLLSDDLVASASPIPEPETYALMLAGLGLLGFTLRRRKQQEQKAAA